MALSSTTSRNDYIGNDAASVYVYSFRIFLDSELHVTVRNTSDDETVLVLTTDYTVTGEGEASGGNVTLVNSGQSWLNLDGTLKQDFVLTIRRIMPLTQQTDIRNQGSYFPETHEDEFDRGIMIDQQQQDEIDRCVKLAESILPSDFDPTLPADIQDNPNTVISVNATGDGLTLGLSTTVADLSRLFGRGTRAELDALVSAGPTVSRYFYATDEEIFYFYSGVASDKNDGFIVLG